MTDLSIPSMTAHPILPSRNEDYGFFRTLTTCPQRDRRSADVWALASTMIADATYADSEDEMSGGDGRERLTNPTPHSTTGG